MSWKLKLDEAGHVVVGQDGHPVYVADDGKESSFDGPKLLETLGKVRDEHKGDREKRAALEGRLKAFGDRSDEDILKALDVVANLDQSKLVEAGKVDEVVNGRLQPMRDAWMKEKQELSDAVAKAQALLKSHVLKSRFAEWEGADNYYVTWDFLEAKYGDYFDVDESLNVVPFKDPSRKDKLYNRQGEVASFGEAIDELLSHHPHRDKIRKGNPAKGSDAPPQDQRGRPNQPDLSNLPPEERLARHRASQSGAN